MTLITIFVILLLLIAAAYLIMTVYPAFGRRAGEQERARNLGSAHYSKGKFAYPQTAELSGDKAGSSGLSILKDFIKGNPTPDLPSLFSRSRCCRPL